MAVLAFLFFSIAIIVGFIIRAVEIAAETGSTVVRKSSDFAHYVKTQWEEAQNDTQV